ncbi:MAG: NAD(P)-dependent oxidoreductase [Terracidiphilus sp.]
MKNEGVISLSEKNGYSESSATEFLSERSFIIGPNDPILITGATGFIGSRVVECLIAMGFQNLRCFTRGSGKMDRIEAIISKSSPMTRIEVIKGNLLRREDCDAASNGAAVVLHLAAGTGEKSFPDAFMNSVVTTRNLLESSLRLGCLQRFALVSSFAVYSNRQKRRLLDESCPIEEHPEKRDAYCYAKVKQEEIVKEYAQKTGVRTVILRPGSVYGTGNREITGRVGIGTFGLFLHLGGSNRIPFTYVDNCAYAIALAALTPGVDGEVFNILDDEVPSSRQFLRAYKKYVRNFKSIYIPHFLSYGLCLSWEKYSEWSQGQLPPAFTRRQWSSLWRKTYYSNVKLKKRLGWSQKISTAEAMQRYFTDGAPNEHTA